MLPEIITVLVNALCYFHLPLLTPKMRETELTYQSEIPSGNENKPYLMVFTIPFMLASKDLWNLTIPGGFSKGEKDRSLNLNKFPTSQPEANPDEKPIPTL